MPVIQMTLDIWGERTKHPFGNSEWLEEETNRHILNSIGKLAVRPSKYFAKNLSKVIPSDLPAMEVPHPGMSYNPSYKDHLELLREIAKKEEHTMKEQKHLTRVTTDMFSSVSPQEKENLWMSEMSEGLNEEKGKDDENKGDYVALNPPTSFAKKKTLKKKRKQIEAKKEAHERKKLLIEKKKLADIYKLRHLMKIIVDNKKSNKKKTEKETKRVGKKKFEAACVDFKRPHEIEDQLIKLKPEGNVLKDIFITLQRRNILEVTSKQLKVHKTKKKRFVKPGHRIEI